MRKRMAAMAFLTLGAWTLPAASQPLGNQLEGVGKSTAASGAKQAESPRSSWYGYQTLATDGAALALAIISAEKDSTAAGVGAASIYVLGAPTVHALHRRPLTTLGSIAIRLVMPLFGSALGAASANCSTRVVNDENCDFGPGLTGFAVGMAAAAVLDSAVLAWDRPSPTPARPAASQAAPSLTQSLSLSPVPVRGGAGLAFGGPF
jgi:hypothetical protein